MAQRGDTLILGTRKGLFLFERRGGDWKPAGVSFLGIPISFAMIDPRTGILWAGQDHGHWGCKLSRSRDRGRTWEEVAAPKYPEGEVIKNSMMSVDPKAPEKPATLRYIWCIAPGAADEPQRLYLGSEPGGLFVSDDGGETWALNRPLWDHPSRLAGQWFGGGRDHAGIHSIIVDPTNRKRLLVGISCAGTFETTDGGASWTVRNTGLKSSFLPEPNPEVGHDPHLVAMCPASTKHLWQQNHCGIWKSEDGARTWANVSENGGPANFGFAIAVDEKDPQAAWVAPAVSDECRVAVGGALCICRTTDGGRTWKALREGLPQEQCYDVVFRHSLDKAGDRLAFGTTTGNVYWSDDRGERWRCLGCHFPLVYSLRFA